MRVYATYYSKKLRRRIKKRYNNVKAYIKAERALRKKKGLILKRRFFTYYK